MSPRAGPLQKIGPEIRHHVHSFYLGRRKLVPDAQSGMPHWQDRLFIALRQCCDRSLRLFPPADEPGWSNSLHVII